VKLARSAVVAVVAALALAATVLAWRAPATDQTSPPVSYTLLDVRKGSTESLRVKVLLIDSWATSHTTCVAKMPQIIATHNKLSARGYETLAVAMSYDPPAYVAHFAQTRRLPFGVAIDNTGEIAKHFGDIGLTPTTLVIDRRGAIVKRYLGAPDFAALHAPVEGLLAQT
jgi:peroxiredoxin